MSKKTVYEIITEQIIKLIEAGTSPWRQTWKGSQEVAMNWYTENEYRGINRLLTRRGGEYATMAQIKKSGGKIKPDQLKHYTYVVYYVFPDSKEDEEKDKAKENQKSKNPYPLYHKVYEINEQCEGLTSKRKMDVEEIKVDPIEKAEQLVNNFLSRPNIIHASGRAFYKALSDTISVPPIEDFEITEEYYSTLFHELVHSTGHEKRLNRKFGGKFGDVKYSKEELIAEIGASMLCGMLGIEEKTIENSASYLAGWLKVLKADSRMIILSANAAQKAVDYIQNIDSTDSKTA